MNRGCVSVGEINCDSCKGLIEQGERYLLMEEDGNEDESKKTRLCVDCCLAKDYAAYIKEKGEEILTFFPSLLNVNLNPDINPETKTES